MKLYPIVVTCMLLACSSFNAAAATIYKKIDADGNVTFTDVPPRAEESAETIDLESPNYFTPPPGAVGPAIDDEDEEEEAEAVPPHEYTSVEVASPDDDATLRQNAGNVTITTTVEPFLAPNHLLRLLLDGSPAGNPNRTGTFNLANIDRGTHQIQIQVVEPDGTVVFGGEPSVFHLLRYSAIRPGQ